MQVPFVDLRPQHQKLDAELKNAWSEILRNASFILGEHVERFERDFAAYCGTKHAIGVANGTDAITLALKAVGVQPGDEVITAANSFVASAEAIVHAGAKPVFVDPDPETCTLDVSKLEAAVTSRTRAILPVHLYGRPAEMQAIATIASRHSIPVVEDAAQAHGADYQGRRVGSFGNAACFSFYPAKNLGACGDGGAVVTSDDAVALTIRKLRDHGGVEKYRHDLVGFNSRLDALQAAALRIKLPHLDSWNEARKRHADRYRELLGNMPGLALPPVGGVYHLFVVRVLKGSRAELIVHLRENGIQTGVHYPNALPLTPAFSFLQYDASCFPVAVRLADSVLSLPMFPELEAAQIDHVASSVRAYFERLR